LGTVVFFSITRLKKLTSIPHQIFILLLYNSGAKSKGGNMKKVGIIISGILLVVLVILLVGGAGMMLGNGRFGMMGRGMFGGYTSPLGFGFHLVGTILSILFWALVIGGGVWLVTKAVRPNTSGNASPTQTPLDILKLRYAKGEVTKEQFEQMKQDLA
jgi:putative membrane protein